VAAGPDGPAIVFRGERFPARAGQDVLSLLLEGQADIMYLCMAGSCGTCRVRVLAGSEHLEPMDAAERTHFPTSQGEVRLACQARCRGGGDVVVEQD
jgi:ferredoxin